MSFFHVDRKLEVLEKQGLYMCAANYTFSRWLKDRDNLESLLRAGTEAWFADVNDCLSNDLVDLKQCCSNLTEAYQYGTTHFSDNSHFLCTFGYMLKLFPYYFNVFDGDFEKWSQHGKEMIKRAHQLMPSDIFVQSTLSLDTGERIYLPDDYFQGNSEMEVYFSAILCR